MAIEELFEGTDCSVYFVEDIVQDQWAKYASNICYNLPQAVLNLPFGAYLDSEHVDFLKQKLFDEVYQVGAALGRYTRSVQRWESRSSAPLRRGTAARRRRDFPLFRTSTPGDIRRLTCLRES